MDEPERSRWAGWFHAGWLLGFRAAANGATLLTAQEQREIARTDFAHMADLDEDERP